MSLATATALHTTSPVTPSTFLFGNHDAFARTPGGAYVMSGFSSRLLLTTHAPEHVLRVSSNGSDPTGFRSRNRSSSIITNPYEGFEIPPSDDFAPFKARPNGRSARPSKYSPTPSIKRGKAELLLKEHGSPPGIRVTAGGRIVPDGLTPITSPRFDQRRPYAPRPPAQINIPPIDMHNLPSPGYLHTVQGYLVVSDGHIYQVHNGGLINVGQVGSPTLDLVCPPSNHVHAPGSNYHSGVDWQVPAHQMTFAGFPPVPEHANIDDHTIRKLEECHAKFQEELRDLDRNEVLQRDSLTAGGKREIVRQRVSLVNRIDETRRSILTTRKVLNEKTLAQPSHSNKIGDPQQSKGRIISPTMFPTHHAMSVPTSFDYGFKPAFDFPAPDASQYSMTAPLLPQPFWYNMQDASSGEPVGPDFSLYQSRHGYATGEQLQARAGNVGLGISHNLGITGNDNPAGKSYDEPIVPKIIDPDGGSQQVRRSRAVPIKAPEKPVADKKTALNPASPSYQPRASADQKSNPGHVAKPSVTDESAFMPSLKQVADVDQLVQSPARQHVNVCQPPNSSHHRVSSSTAGTEDFFPQDAQEHSTTRYSYNIRQQAGGLQDWMSQENNPKPLSTPQRTSNISNKFMWNESPDDRFYDALPEHEDCPRSAPYVKDFAVSTYEDRLMPSRHDGAHGDVAVVLSPSPTKVNRPRIDYRTHSHEATIINAESPLARTPGGQTPVGYLMRGDSEAVPMPISPVKNLYRLGLDDGLTNKLDGVHSELEYLQGLREGLQERTRQIRGENPRGVMSLAAVQHRVASAFHSQGHDRASDPGHGPLTRRESMPSYGAPGAPVNTPLGTPTATTPKTGKSFDGMFSPATALAFSSQPNVKVADIHRGVGTQTSASRLQRPELAVSPLMKRGTSNSPREATFGSPVESFTARMQRLDVGDLQHAYASRSKASVMPSAEQAHAVFHQHDGLDEGIERRPPPGSRNGDGTSGSRERAARSPLRTVGQPGGSKSPGKRLASAAATVLAYGRKLASPELHPRSPVSPGSNKTPSPTKARMGWRRRAEDKAGTSPN